jgi:hypothetical protein
MSPVMPIPGDWDGQSWTCIQVVWPDSDLWLGILAGLLTIPTRGRFWDERSGSILATQMIGREIDRRNLPFNPCEGETPPSGGGNGGFSGDLIDAIGECLAMNCSIPYGALKYIDGVLHFRYCGEWYPVQGAASLGDIPLTGEDTTEDDDGWTPPEIDGGGYSACGKAEAVMAMVYGVIESIMDEYGNASWTWWGHIKNDNPGVGMDAKWIVSACFGMVNQQGADAALGPEYDPDALDASTWQSVKCLLAAQFSDTLPEPLGGNDVRALLMSYFASEWGIDILTNAIFQDALRGINRESFEQAIITGASYDEADCTCPDINDYTGGIRFLDTWDTATHPTWITYYQVSNNGKELLIEWSAPAGDYQSDDILRPKMEFDAGVTEFQILQQAVPGYPMPKNEWFGPGECDGGVMDWAWPAPNSFTNVRAAYGASGLMVTSTNATPLTTNRADWFPRKCPDNPGGGAVVYRAKLSIFSIEGVPV